MEEFNPTIEDNIEYAEESTDEHNGQDRPIDDISYNCVLGISGREKFQFNKKTRRTEQKQIEVKKVCKILDRRRLIKEVCIKPKYKNKEFVAINKVPKEVNFEGNVEFDEHQIYEIEEEEGSTINRYFESYINKKNMTSDNTLADLQNLEVQHVLDGIQQIYNSKSNLKEFLTQFHKKIYPQWKFELDNNFNLLFYGYGSKRETLLDFAEECLNVDNNEVLVINGYFPDLTIKQILLSLCKLVNVKCLISKLNETIELIKEALENQSEINNIYILVHNIDGENLRNINSQNAFLCLSKINNIKLIVSIDHIHATILWDNSSLHRMNFLFHEMTTLVPYKVETSFESSSLIPNASITNGNVTIRGVKHVLTSVNTKAKGIFKILTKEQLKEDNEYIQSQDNDNELVFNQKSKSKKISKSKHHEQVGLSAQQFYNLCRKKFLASNLAAFHANLVEFLDHGLIKQVKTNSGVKYFIPMDKQALQAILELDELNNI